MPDLSIAGGTREPVDVSVLVSRLNQVRPPRLSSHLAQSSRIQEMRGDFKGF